MMDYFVKQINFKNQFKNFSLHLCKTRMIIIASVDPQKVVQNAEWARIRNTVHSHAEINNTMHFIENIGGTTSLCHNSLHASSNTNLFLSNSVIRTRIHTGIVHFKTIIISLILNIYIY